MNRTLLAGLISCSGLAFMPPSAWAAPASTPSGQDRASAASGRPSPATDPASFSRLPVKDVTVFKDGHAFVRHAGQVTLDAQGKAQLDRLPTPIMGAFWVSSVEPGLLKSVTAGWRDVAVRRKGLDLIDLIEANVGRAAIITEVDGQPYSAVIEDVPLRRDPEGDSAAAPAQPTLRQAPPPSSGAEVVVLRMAHGVRVLPLSRIRDLSFPDGYEPRVSRSEQRTLLTLDFGAGARPGSTVDVGMGYVQRGLRWIPSYRFEAREGGRAHVWMQATLLNELTDLQDATVNLVIGVPTFSFKETLDPMAMQQSLAQLSSYFREGDRNNLANFMSNAVMSQTMRMSEYAEQPAPGTGAADLGPDAPQGGAVEDLFVWTLEHVSLRKGDRMVLPVTEFDVTYADRFVLEVPISPLPEMRNHFNSRYESDLAKLLIAPKVMHRLRITNSTEHPLTTAPILMLRDGRPLGQGLMTYTPPRGTVDVDVTAAVGIAVAKSDSEVERTPKDLTWRREVYQRIDLQGSVTLTNFKDVPVDVSVIRHVLGIVDEASHEGKLRKQNVLELSPGAGSSGLPQWWYWYSWPWWWWNVNGVGRVDWEAHIEPGASVELTYLWHYYYP
ncbi:MAG: hypothetical protein IT449_00800 [Phycisphaerales bacterium]|nr:hypothetical protein [Phycisphaerales bacterium]